ncbi:MAG TPA: hypothetical protein VII50_00950 [Acidothermaceae bacterium]
MPRQASRIALAAAATVAITLPLTGTASAMSYDRHVVARTAVTVKATPGHLALARKDVLQAGGQVVRWLPTSNGFVAQVPITAVVGLKSAPGIASVSVLGALIRE